MSNLCVTSRDRCLFKITTVILIGFLDVTPYEIKLIFSVMLWPVGVIMMKIVMQEFINLDVSVYLFNDGANFCIFNFVFRGTGAWVSIVDKPINTVKKNETKRGGFDWPMLGETTYLI